MTKWNMNRRKLLDMQKSILPRQQAPSIGGMSRVDPNGNITSVPEVVYNYSVQTYLVSGDANTSQPPGMDSNGYYPGYIMNPIYLTLSGALSSGGINCRLVQPPFGSGILTFLSGSLVQAMQIGITTYSTNYNDAGLPLLVPIVPNNTPVAPWIQFTCISGTTSDFTITSGEITDWQANTKNAAQLGSGLVWIEIGAMFHQVQSGGVCIALLDDPNHYKLVQTQCSGETG